MANWMKYLPYILLTPFYLVLGSFIYYFFISLTPAQEIRVIDWQPKTVVAGDEVTITYDVRRNRNCDNRITRFLYNKRTLSTTTIGYIERTVVKGVDPNFESVIKIPVNVSNGDYELSAENKPVCNFYDYFFPTIIPIPAVAITVNNDPVILYNLQVLNKDLKVKKGEPIQLRNVFNKRRFCSAVVDTFFFRADNDKIDENDILTAKFSRPTTSIQLGPNDVRENVPLDVDVGNYYGIRSVTYTCPDRVYNFRYNKVYFEVVP